MHKTPRIFLSKILENATASSPPEDEVIGEKGIFEKSKIKIYS